MKKVILMTKPPVTTYPEIANILSLLWDRKEKIIPWYSDHFIQIIVRPDNPYTYGDFYDHADLDNYFSIMYGMPWLGWMRNNSETIPCAKFTEYVEHEINNGYGLQACLDRYFINFTESYQTEHVIHAAFIYGYDSEKQEVYAADFWNGGRYEHIVISYDEVNAAMNNDGLINLFKSQDAEYEIDLKLMKRYFEDYYKGDDSFGLYAASNRDYNRSAIFGWKYYDYIQTAWIEKSEQNESKDDLDIRLFHLLYDHKILMDIRLNYLASLGIFESEVLTKLINDNKELLNLTYSLRNRVIKFDVAHSSKALSKIKEDLYVLKQKDRDFVSNILEMLEDI